MRLFGVPAEQLDEMRQYPCGPMWEAISATLAYDAAAVGEDASVPPSEPPASGPTLAWTSGELSFMHFSSLALANAIPSTDAL